MKIYILFYNEGLYECYYDSHRVVAVFTNKTKANAALKKHEKTSEKDRYFLKTYITA